MKVFVIVGQSGAGLTSALGALEDMDCRTVRGLPAPLLPSFVSGGEGDAAASIHVRSERDAYDLLMAVEQLRDDGIDCKLIYLEAEQQTLINRYKSTRRPHPMAKGSRTTLQAVGVEKEFLMLLREKADAKVDTTGLTARQLRETIIRIATGTQENILSVSVVSFGFKYGIPTDADLVFDVRFLPNPYYVPQLRAQTGTEQAVRDYIFRDGTADEYMDKLYDLTDFLIPQYQREGKAVLTIAVGCTGGRHRSVAIAQELYEHMQSRGIKSTVIHRDRQKG